MDYIESILLGIVQGLTEFLPISSSGHLEIFKEHEKFNPFGTKIYRFKENENYLLELKRVLKSLDGGK